MLKLNKVAVTGGLACGKSSACRFFKALGAYVVSADEIVHQLLSPQISLGQQVIALLGADIVVNGQIDRSLIAKKVFNNQKLLQSLQMILHPAVQDEIERQYQKVKKEGSFPLFVAEIPLLFETAGEKTFDYTVAVRTDPEYCRQRFKASTGYGDDEYNKRMAQQLSPDEKARRADYTIENNGTAEDLYKAVVYLYQMLIS